MTDEQIERVATLGEVQARTTLRAPIAGVIVDLAAREGMTVMPGDTLFRINGLSTVWVNAEVPESQASLVVPGATAEARSPAQPDVVFKGVVQTILPNVDPATRTLKARVEIENPNRRLAPGMFVSVTIEGARTSALWVPSEAVIRTGQRTVVMVVDERGSFQSADVEAGIERGDRTEIKRGLAEGQRIVASGQFLIDSEANLRAATSRMESTPGSRTNSPEHTGEGKVETIDASNVVISHGPIPSIQWGSMTMQFVLPREGVEPGLRVGEAVRFSFTMGDDGKPRIDRIEPLASAPQ
jgi:Cu(I)/Ag(I) efflux system membrane fusion protein